MRFVFLAAVLIGLLGSLLSVTHAASTKTCTKSNTTFKECESSTQPTCDNPSPRVVTADCQNGCFCKTGYVLNKSRDCILVENCK